MAKKNIGNKSLIITLCVIMLFVGIVCGCGIVLVANPPKTDVTADVYYSENQTSQTKIAEGIAPAVSGAVSVHFLELGNKYTGDCTYIKVGENIDILIDCGSRASSVQVVKSYLDNYVKDNTLEYVIVTHAHQDHYAGFATSTSVDSIFDIYECKNVITFARTNQKSKTADTGAIVKKNSELSKSNTMFDNFLRELKDEENNGANVKTALEILNDDDNYIDNKITIDSASNIYLQILDNKYYREDASTENDYSVCCQLLQGEKKFIFTGDLEEGGESYLVDNNVSALSQVEVYKAGHHGSKTSSSEKFLNVIKPKIVCVCCCAGSSEYTSTVENQFPTTKFINNISKYTTQVYVTTLCEDYKNNKFTSFNGNIVISFNKNDNSALVSCSNNAILLKDSTWFKENRLSLCGESLHASWRS